MDLILVSNDHMNFKLEEKSYKQSTFLVNLFEQLNSGGTPIEGIPEVTIPFSSAVLAKVVEFLEHHKNDLEIQQSNKLYDISNDVPLDHWDEYFCKVDQQALFDIIKAANYLGCTKLLDVTCKVVANMIKNKSVAEIRETFGIENDWTPEEEIKIREENTWIFSNQ